LTSGTEDHVVPLKVTKAVNRLYSQGPSDTTFHVFEGRGHSLTIDNSWKEVADVVLKWLTVKGF
jgi:esterase/lipase